MGKFGLAACAVRVMCLFATYTQTQSQNATSQDDQVLQRQAETLEIPKSGSDTSEDDGLTLHMPAASLNPTVCRRIPGRTNVLSSSERRSAATAATSQGDRERNPAGHTVSR